MRRSADARGNPSSRSPSQNSTAAPPGGTGEVAVHASPVPVIAQPDRGDESGACRTWAVAVTGATRAATTKAGNSSFAKRMRFPLIDGWSISSSGVGRHNTSIGEILSCH